MRRVRQGPSAANGNTSPLPQTPLPLDQATAGKTYVTQWLSAFDLPNSASLPFRVYVLRCLRAGTTDMFMYYVGLIDKLELENRMRKHAMTLSGCPRFTRVHKALGLELLWPAASRASEAYAFSFMLTKFPSEVDVLETVVLGGYVQTAVAPLPTNTFLSLQGEYRMVQATCLDCGLPGHYAGATKCKGYTRIAGLSASSTISSSSLTTVASSSRAAAPVDTKRTSSSSASAVLVPAIDYEQRASDWLSTHNFVAEWLGLPAVLGALREPSKNPNRYLQSASDCKSKLWLLGANQQAPKWNEDYKRSGKRHGANNPFLVCKTFLKRVLMERYRHKLQFYWTWVLLDMGSIFGKFHRLVFASFTQNVSTTQGRSLRPCEKRKKVKKGVCCG